MEVLQALTSAIPSLLIMLNQRVEIIHALVMFLTIGELMFMDQHSALESNKMITPGNLDFMRVVLYKLFFNGNFIKPPRLLSTHPSIFTKSMLVDFKLHSHGAFLSKSNIDKKNMQIENIFKSTFNK